MAPTESLGISVSLAKLSVSLPHSPAVMFSRAGPLSLQGALLGHLGPPLHCHHCSLLLMPGICLVCTELSLSSELGTSSTQTAWKELGGGCSLVGELLAGSASEGSPGAVHSPLQVMEFHELT